MNKASLYVVQQELPINLRLVGCGYVLEFLASFSFSNLFPAINTSLTILIRIYLSIQLSV